MALTDKLKAIADAIRGKTGKTDEMTLDQMAVEIAGIQAGGGSGGLYETGEIIGDGVTHNSDASALQIPISFEPDFMFICLTDTTATLDENHVYGGILVKDTFCHMSHRVANSANSVNAGYVYKIDGLYGGIYNRGSYANGVFSWVLTPSGRAFYNGASYTWIARKW